MGSMIVQALFAVVLFVFWKDSCEKPIERRLRKLSIWSMIILLCPGFSDFINNILPQEKGFYDVIPVVLLSAYCATLIISKADTRPKKIGAFAILLVLVMCAGPDPLFFKADNVVARPGLTKFPAETKEMKEYFGDATVIMPYELAVGINEADGITNLYYGVNSINDGDPASMADTGRANGCTYVVIKKTENEYLTDKRLAEIMQDRYYRYDTTIGDYLIFVDSPELYPE